TSQKILKKTKTPEQNFVQNFATFQKTQQESISLISSNNRMEKHVSSRDTQKHTTDYDMHTLTLRMQTTSPRSYKIQENITSEASKFSGYPKHQRIATYAKPLNI